MRVLVVNAGSSSVKLSLLGPADETLAEHELDAPRATVDPRELAGVLSGDFAHADAVGHRIVHGGEHFSDAVRVNPEVQAALRDLVDLAPLHQPKSLAALHAVSIVLPDLPAVACFDTAFHRTMPDAATTYAVPERWRRSWRVRRYGFHGLSHAWVARRAPQLLGVAADQLALVSCHLGAGASLCAIADGRSVDTTMGFTPLEGLVMATRSGSVDPGLLLWVLEHEAMTPRELAHTLEHESGLLGLAGSADMREVLNRARAGEPVARAALDVYGHRLRAGIAAMAASLGRLDAIVFTGGIGERAPAIRADAIAGLTFLGASIDAGRNAAPKGDSELTASGAHVRTLVIRAREDLEIAHQVRRILG